MTKQKVLFIATLDESLDEFTQFSSEFEILRYQLSTKTDLIKRLQTDFADISAIYGGWMGFMGLGGLTDDLIEFLPPSLKCIAICSVGHDSYDSKCLQEKGIQLYNTPSLGAEAVADTALWHILESFRLYSVFQTKARELSHTVQARDSLQTKDFNHQTGQLGQVKDEWLSSAFPFGEIAGGITVESPIGKKCGILGFGNIGEAVGKRAKAIGMDVIYNQRNVKPKIGYEATYYEDLKEMAKISDVLVISCPGNEHTKGLVNQEIIDSLKPTSTIINIGRGMILDESYAISQLEKGFLKWVGIDVFTKEPLIDKRLVQRKDVSLTPHIGSSTKQNYDATAVFALRNIWRVLKGEEGFSRVV